MFSNDMIIYLENLDEPMGELLTVFSGVTGYMINVEMKNFPKYQQSTEGTVGESNSEKR